MYKVALFHPWGHTFFYMQSPGGGGFYNDYRFIVNDANEPVDICVVWGGINTNEIKVKCPKGKLIYMTEEAHDARFYNQKFIDQFDAVIACRDDIKHKHLIRTHEINTWHIPYSWDELYDNHVPKTKDISIVASDLTILTGHKKRFAFVNKLIGHFKDRLDVFGRGFNELDDKWLGLAPYKYSIAIENSSIPGYFTEKLSECYLANCMPIYYGAPNIADYFDVRTILQIDINDYKKSIRLVEELLEANPYEQLKGQIIFQKQKYLTEYHLYPALCKLFRQYFKDTSEIKPIVRIVKAEQRFEKFHHLKKATQSIREKIMNS